jgi:hypothetical protein
VTAVVTNPATSGQTYQFGFAMPRSSFISDVQLSGADGVVATATIKETDWVAHATKKNGNGNGHVNGNGA